MQRFYKTFFSKNRSGARAGPWPSFPANHHHNWNYKMKTAYLDCFSGISGDMFIGALLDAGLPFEELERNLRTLPLKAYSLEARLEERNKIFGTRFIVGLESPKDIPRDLEAIRGIIRQSKLSHAVKKKSIEVFEEIARIEGKIHNLAPDQVHFHEIGAVDSIIDIVGTLFGIEYLGINKISASRLPLGSGFAETSHGRIPIPAPATIALLKGVPVFDSGVAHELVTPTGAALVKKLASSFGPMPSMVMEKIGYGTGKRQLPDRPNMLRILIGDVQSEQQIETVVVLETNLDDTSPELLGYIMEKLFEKGALDVAFSPVTMKKNRPGIQVQVIARPDHKDALMEILFRESSALGIRFQYTRRKVLERYPVEVDSPWGKIMLKKIIGTDGSPCFMPEYEACKAISRKNDLPLKEIYCWVMGLNKGELGV